MLRLTKYANASKAVIVLRWIAPDVPGGKVANTDYFLTSAGTLVTSYTNSGEYDLESEAGTPYYCLSDEDEADLAAKLAALGFPVQAKALIFTGSAASLGDAVDEPPLPFFDSEEFTEVTSTEGATIVRGSSSLVVAVSGETPRQDLIVTEGAVHAFRITFVNEDGTYPNYTGDTLTMIVKDHAGVERFQIEGTIDTEYSAGDTGIFTTTADNTTDDLDAQLSPARAAAVDRTSLKYDIWHEESGDVVCCGPLLVREA